MAVLRFIHAGLIGLIVVTTLVISFFAYVLVYAVEPTTFSWHEVEVDHITNATGAEGVMGEEACDPIILAQAPIGLGSIADFATEAVIQINTYDYLNWDQAVPDALNTYFTPTAARVYNYLFERSRLLRTVQGSYYTVSATNIRPAMVTSTGTVDGQRTWTVQVPVTIRYQTGVTDAEGGQTAHAENEVFTLTILEQSPNRRNFRGVAINDITHDAVREVDDLDKLE